MADASAGHRRRRDRTAIRQLVAAPLPEPLASSTVIQLAFHLRLAGEGAKALELVRLAQQQHPDDFWLCYAMVFHTLRQGPSESEEVVRYDTAALALRPGSAFVHNGLGIALVHRQKPAEAVVAFRKAIDLKPEYALAYYNLGVALEKMNELDEAVAALRRAIDLKPDLAFAYNNLGNIMYKQKKLVEPEAAFQKADRLLPNQPLFRNNLRQTQHLLELDRKLAACLAGQDRPVSPRQAIELAAFAAGYRERYHAAAHFYTEAIRDDPSLTAYRYTAARFAALAAAGQGQDAAALSTDERTGLRRQALAWLQADLNAWQRGVLDGNPRDRADADDLLRARQWEPALATVRHPWSLLRLPPDERRQWQKLWADVEALLKKASKIGM